MSTLTIRLPDTKHERLKAFARTRGVSVNKLVEELATVALAQADAEASPRWACSCSTSLIERPSSVGDGWPRFGVDVFRVLSTHRAIKRNDSTVSLTVKSRRPHENSSSGGNLRGSKTIERRSHPGDACRGSWVGKLRLIC